MDIKEAIQKVVEGGNLSFKEAQDIAVSIITRTSTEAQIGGFLTALRMKGESVDEIAAFAQTLRVHGVKIYPKVNRPLIDTCGTGGDKIKTFNVSTLAALTAAAAGACVAKHGGRSVTSRCGSADLMEALGVNVNAEPEVVKRCIERVGIGYLYAPMFHPTFKAVADVRRSLGIRTIFNLLGPLINPASTRIQLIGVSHPQLTITLCEVLKLLGGERAYVIHGVVGVDEISMVGKTIIAELNNGRISTRDITPEMMGLNSADEVDAILGGDLHTNLRSAIRVLRGIRNVNFEMTALNAAAALELAGIVKNMRDGVELAMQTLSEGRVLETLRQLITESGGDEGKLEGLLNEFSN